MRYGLELRLSSWFNTSVDLGDTSNLRNASVHRWDVKVEARISSDLLLIERP
jgi:hypothetical protein